MATRPMCTSITTVRALIMAWAILNQSSIINPYYKTLSAEIFILYGEA